MVARANVGRGVAKYAGEGGTNYHNQEFTTDLYPNQRSAEIHRWSTTLHHLLNLELSLETNRDVAELDNRFPTMTEMRRAGWPRYEQPEWSEREFP